MIYGTHLCIHNQYYVYYMCVKRKLNKIYLRVCSATSMKWAQIRHMSLSRSRSYSLCGSARVFWTIRWSLLSTTTATTTATNVPSYRICLNDRIFYDSVRPESMLHIKLSICKIVDRNVVFSAWFILFGLLCFCPYSFQFQIERMKNLNELEFQLQTNNNNKKTNIRRETREEEEDEKGKIKW